MTAEFVGYLTPGSRDWLAFRRTGVTASEIAVILGLSRWDSPWALWHRKRGILEDVPAGEAADWGHRLESVIADAAAERLDPHGSLRFLPAGSWRRADRPWQIAHPDRLVKLCLCGPDDDPDVVCSCLPHEGEPVALLEVKHPYSWDGWGDDGSDDVPADHHAQCLWQLDVMGLDECWLAAYTRHRMRCYTIRRDADGVEDDLELMRFAAWQFLTSEEPPPLDSHPATLAAVKALHPNLEDREQEVDPGLIGEYLHAVAAEKTAKRVLDLAKARMILAMGAARYAVRSDGRPVATRSIYERRSVDGARLRVDHPDIAERYTNTTTVDRLLPAREDHHEQDQ